MSLASSAKIDNLCEKLPKVSNLYGKCSRFLETLGGDLFRSGCGVASFSGGAASRLARACNIRPCRSELVTSDGITASGAASLNSAATIALADDLVSNFASMAGAGNAVRTAVRTDVTVSGMAPNASATLAFGVAMLGRGTAI